MYIHVITEKKKHRINSGYYSGAIFANLFSLVGASVVSVTVVLLGLEAFTRSSSYGAPLFVAVIFSIMFGLIGIVSLMNIFEAMTKLGREVTINFKTKTFDWFDHKTNKLVQSKLAFWQTPKYLIGRGHSPETFNLKLSDDHILKMDQLEFMMLKEIIDRETNAKILSESIF